MIARAEDGAIVVACALARELGAWSVPAEVEVFACGVGPVEAAAAVAARLARGGVRVLLNAGIGGVFEERGSVGDAVAIDDESLADLGLEGGAPLVLPDGAALVDRVAADAALVARARAAGLRVARGLTVSLVTATDATGRARRDRYDADVESMEGFAVLRAAALARVPALELRGISNVARERARAGWDFAAGTRALARALDAVVPSLLRR